MKDCRPPFREKANLWLIWVGCKAMGYVRGQRRAGSKTASVLVLALTAVTVANAFQWPAGWWAQGWGRATIVVLSALAGVGALLVGFGYQSLLGRSKRRTILAQSAEDLALLIEQVTKMKRTEFGVNVWVIKGVIGFRRLVRGPSVTAQHSDTPIAWTKGKGIIGQAWKRHGTVVADLDEVRAEYPTVEAWCGRSREERYRLSWDEFRETYRYRAVVAVPLRAGGAFAKIPRPRSLGDGCSHSRQGRQFGGTRENPCIQRHPTRL